MRRLAVCRFLLAVRDRKMLGFSRVAYPPHDLHNLTRLSSQRMAVSLVKDDEGQ